jgi:branched-subunit amino acid ABC-type transport system permease component
VGSFLQAVVSGLVMGSIYALMTVGMTLIYGTLRTLNMSLGAMVMIGGYASWMVFDSFGWGPVAGIGVAAIVAFAFGVLVQQVAVRPLIGRHGFDFEMTAFISTFALAIVLSNLALRIYGARNKAVPPVIRGRLQLLEGVSVSYHSLILAAVAVAMLVALGLFLSRTRYGLGISAVAQQLDAARLMGIPVNRVYNLTMGVSSALAGVAGVLLGSVFFVSPNAGDLPLLKALIVAIFGGLGSVRGTIAAAYIIGLLESLISLYFGVKWSLPVLFVVIIVVLLIRPTGLYGKPEEARL